ncbi:MAG: hypothetical protein IMY67_12180 [Bacteroidetes bacterium]|nr:hypothetical protein [Bacteroidota bacterium]
MTKKIYKLCNRDHPLSPSIISGLVLVVVGVLLLVSAFVLDRSVTYAITSLGFGFSALGIAAPLELLAGKLKK